tara:strand:+ start:2891 stop:3247 length:357 start_codon:yes stop_codon:yes gene_type:complete
MPKKKTPPAFTLDTIDIHALQKKAAAGDKERRLAIEAMSATEQASFAKMPKTRQTELLAMSAAERAEALGGGKIDPGAAGGPMDAFAKGKFVEVGKKPSAIVPDKDKKVDKKPAKDNK